MIENWFTNKCMTLVGVNGRVLTGDALKAAESKIKKNYSGIAEKTFRKNKH